MNETAMPLIHAMWATGHDLNCEWQFEQYDFECTCGATRPTAPWFVPYERAVTNDRP